MSTINIVLGKSFMLDTFYLQRSNRRFTECDTKVCYDRIIPLVLILAYLNEGLPYDTCVVFANILYNIKYVIITAYGTGLQINYFGMIEAIFWIGQGLTDRLLEQTCISDLILKYYYNKFKEFKLKDSINLSKYMAMMICSLTTKSWSTTTKQTNRTRGSYRPSEIEFKDMNWTTIANRRNIRVSKEFILITHMWFRTIWETTHTEWTKTTRK